MTVKDILEKVEEIRTFASDDEAAHSAEDALWEQVLEAIAKGGLNSTGLRQLATAALKTRNINFARWCA